MKRGRLIVFEGSDCSGKSTQINLLIERLRKEGNSVETLDFPNYQTPTGKIVRRYLDNEFGPANEIPAKLASIFYAEDRYASKKFVDEALQKNDIVILDRYVESNMGHQGGKISDPKAREDFFEWLNELEYSNFKLNKPDAVVFLYMPYDVSQQLMINRERKSEFHPGAEKLDGHEGSPEHLRNAENSYLHLARLFDWIKIDCAPDQTMDTLKTPEQISTELWSNISIILERPVEDDAFDPDESNDEDPFNESEEMMTPEDFCLCENAKQGPTEEERARVLSLLEKIYEVK
jgi:dTMP kinase